MIKVINPRINKEKCKPYYELVFKYIIGDDNGDSTYMVKADVDNPYIERLVTLLNSLKPTKGRWGVILDSDRLLDHHKEGQITKDEHYFLDYMSHEGWSSNKDNPYNEIVDSEDEHAWYIWEGIRSEASYSFLVFEGVDLFYYDEYGVKCNTEIVTEEI
tara:strand:+ start:1407 stop:1883 length:477 start_codon:yes stop_codon:yes gene_type:complete